MKRVKLLSDYTPIDNPNVLTIIQDDQGDFHFDMWEGNRKNGGQERGVRITASGGRYSPEVREAFRNLMEALDSQFDDPHCKPAIKEINDRP